MTALPTRDGWACVGCPACGNVARVPLREDESPPWCFHDDGRVVWREPHPETQAKRMVRVTVTLAEEAQA
jgi:hypothetical protein